MPKSRWVLVAALLAIAPIAAFAQTKTITWAIDPGHCVGEFAVRHMMLSQVRGQIYCKGGTIVTPADSLVPTSAKATLDATTLDTRNERRDNDLRNNYFNLTKYPTLTFESTQIVPAGGQKFTMTGNLTVNGVTKPVKFDAEANGSVADSRGIKHSAYSAHTVIDRRDFGMDKMSPIPTGGLVVGTDVDITLQLEAIAQ